MNNETVEKTNDRHAAALATLRATLVAALLTGCGAIQPARMALPDPVRAVEPVAVEGMGAGQRGQFRVGPYRGEFARSATRLELFGDVAVFDRGRTTYTVHGITGEPLFARCTVRQTTMTVGIVGFEPKPLAYECDFGEHGKGVGVRFTLQEGRDAGVPKTLLAERRGRIDFHGTTLTLRSVHAVEGSPLPLATPIGYVFEQDGRAVGAVELNGLAPRLWLPAGDDDTRRAAVAAAIALAIFWDPANRA
jgi:hypothetical protein